MKKMWILKTDIPFAKAGDGTEADEGKKVVATQPDKIGALVLDPTQWPEFFELVELEEDKPRPELRLI